MKEANNTIDEAKANTNEIHGKNGRLKENVKENVKRTKDIKAKLKETKQNKHCPLQDYLHIMSHSL